MEEESLLYGQYNKVLARVKTILGQNQDLIKFLYYKKSDLNVFDNKKFPVNGKIASEVKNNQIKNYTVIDKGSEDCYIMLKIGNVVREKGRDKVDSDFVTFMIGIYICVYQTMLSCENGDRLMALEQCISDSFTDKEVEKTFNCNIKSSVIEKVADGYECRVIPIQVSYYNTSKYGGNK